MAGNYLKGGTPSEIYQQLLAIGASTDHAGLTASAKEVWTDDGAGSKNLAPFTMSTGEIIMTSTKKMAVGDTATYMYQAADGVLGLVSDNEIDLSCTAVDLNGTLDVSGNSQFSGTITVGVDDTGKDVKFFGATSGKYMLWDESADTLILAGATDLAFSDDGGEYITGSGNNLSIFAGTDLNLKAGTDINIDANVGLTFGDDGEKIEGDGTNLTIASSAALTMTGGGASTWSTSAGALTIDGAGGINLGTGSDVAFDIDTAALDIDASGNITIDTTTSGTLSIDILGGASNITSTTDSAAEDFTIAVAGATDSSLILSSTGTEADALQITASAGGIDVSAVGAAGQDIDIVNTGGSVNVSATEDIADAIVLNATTGGIDITADGAAAKELDLTCTSGSVNITAGESAVDSIVISSTNGGIDITAAGASAGEDIDITATGSSVNITATEDAANAIYLRANGGTSETIKVHADQSTADKAIEIIADAGGVDIQAAKTSYGIKIGDDTSGVPIVLGHSTSEITVGDNLTVTGNLTVSGTQSYSALTVSHSSKSVLTLTNTEESDADGGRDG